MNGRYNRRKGHDFERSVAAYLRSIGYEDAHTTRSALGHDGTRQPGDVVGPVGLVISAKNVKQPRWPAWVREVEAEAQGRPWVVVRRCSTDVGACIAHWGGPGTESLPISNPSTFRTFLRCFDGIAA